jgi:hypothetical protein
MEQSKRRWSPVSEAIPIDIIFKGRDYGDVLSECQKAADRAYKAAQGEIGVEDALAAAIYRMYLQGFEDGMSSN